MEFVIVLAVLAIVVVVVSAPLRSNSAGPEPGSGNREIEAARATALLADLEAAREAKYRELRDAELDHRTGKLSQADYETLDRELRSEAVEILKALDRASAVQGAA